ncbi:uncharacterized protein LOC117116985 [Anneissia japonica]|uniref:uncharacterized protein LOC117116985 n=1 Tax=Anneissia japonica TaxID=1529436 RepID=UPI0014258715|nr:uncharacterized protein LOC117116985 [Anneissia japonica]XP_033117045.1 uncharacterized protein LOC117116985 [Anneissia japonica]XP_033117046.1 uncharacterized protein LOC117116985 [Anneissia japonica]
MSSKPAHVFLWTIPRSASTAFTRSMEGIPNVAIYLEPYGSAEHFGPEGRLIPQNTPPTETEYTFDKVKLMLEGDALTNKYVFVKDMAYGVHGRYDKIAKGFKHSFLIRHPAKTFSSYYKMMKNGTGANDVDSDFTNWLPEGLAYKELSDLYIHIEKLEGQKPVVVNADDLVENPKEVLMKYCDAVGLPYSDELLSWDRKPKVKWNMAQAISDLDPIFNWFSNSLTAGGFKKSLSKPLPVLKDLPKTVQECVEKSMPYYDKLNSFCIRP